MVDRESLFPNYALRLSDGSVNSLLAAFHELYAERIWGIFGTLMTVEDTARYAGLLLTLAEGFGLGRRLFLPFGQKTELIMLFWPILGHFWCPVVTFVTFSRNLSNFEKNPKEPLKK